MSWKEIKQRWCLEYDWQLVKITIWLGVFTSLNGVLSQSALPFVDPLLTSVLVQISAPLTWICYPLILNKKYEVGQILSFVLILGGLLFSSLYSYYQGSGSNETFSNSGFWILITLLSAVPTVFETIFQEVAYNSMAKKGKTTLMFIILVYYNTISVVVYFIWMFVTMSPKFGTCLKTNLTTTYKSNSSLDLSSLPLQFCQGNATECRLDQLLPQQRDAIACFFGDYSIECCGGIQATLWTSVFSFGYYIYFTVGAVILRYYGSNTLTNLNVVLVPLSSACFWAEWLVGEFYSTFKWWILVALITTLAGTLLYEYFERKPIYVLDPICIGWYERRYIIKDEKQDKLDIQNENTDLI